MLWFFAKARFMTSIPFFQRGFSCSSSPLVPIPLPSRRETHFWYILPDEVKSVPLLNRYLELLSPREKENVHRMRGDQLQKGALLARALVRTTIARYQMGCQVNPESLKFMKNVYGKPEVEWDIEDDWCPPPLQFNISHTSSMIACGVTLGSPIGVDIEEKQRKIKNNVLAFAQRYFSPKELEMLSVISDPEVQHQEFLKLWTLKESYVKAVGRGFSAAPFKTFTIRYRAATREAFPFAGLNSEESEIIVEPNDNDPTNLTSNWEFGVLEVAGSHYASICVEKDKSIGGPMRLSVRKTVPLVGDECVSGPDKVVPLAGFIKLV